MNKHNLRYLLLAVFSAFLVLHPITTHAQSKRAVRAVEKRNKAVLKRDTNAIVLPPLEQVPEDDPVEFRRLAAAPTNWGVNLLLPEAVAARVRNECTKKVVLEVWDTGPDWLHSSLQKGKLPGVNYTGEPGNDDLNGHSTHCAGIAAGDGFGVASILVEKGLLGVRPVKILTNAGSGAFTMVAAAGRGQLPTYKQSIAAGVPVVISGSFGGGTSLVNDVEAMLKECTDAGALFVFAAGNSGQAGVGYPGRSPYAVAVAALTQSPLARASFSSTGPQVVAAAPGASIYSSYKGNTFATLSGTSMATPFVSGSVCIALSKWGREYLNTPQRLRAYLAWVATDITPIGKDDLTGYGIAYVLSILDKDPRLTPSLPGGPVTPPPPPVTEPLFPARTLTIPLKVNYQFVWNIVGGSGASTASGNAPEVQTYKVPAVAATAGYYTFTVTEIDLGVPTETDLTTTWAKTATNVQEFYTNRGFGLLSPADGAEALKWSAYFLKMLTERAPKPQKVQVLRIVGKGPDGEIVQLNADQIPKWPPN